jgi:hypothetical protein
VTHLLERLEIERNKKIVANIITTLQTPSPPSFDTTFAAHGGMILFRQ